MNENISATGTTSDDFSAVDAPLAHLKRAPVELHECCGEVELIPCAGVVLLHGQM